MDSDGRASERTAITRVVLDPLGEPPKTRLKVTLGAAAVLLVLFLAVAVLVSLIGPHGESQSIAATNSSASPNPSGSAGRTLTESGTPSQPGTLYIHVAGAVAHPGLYVVHTGSRGFDAVAAAGGFTPTADQASLNLARALVDGEQIVVPELGAAPGVASGAGVAGAGASTVASGAKVNINTADATALETLPHVGPALSKRIIDWRIKNGRFSTIEDLLSVTGIGEKTFADLKESVMV